MAPIDERELLHRHSKQIAEARGVVDKTRTVVDISLSVIERSRMDMLRYPPRFEPEKRPEVSTRSP